MNEIRPAQKGEITRQKELWKLCFGDSERYIDFYFANRYKENETLLLLEDKEILSMLTMLPVKIITPDQQSLNSCMLYALATHPQYRNRGYGAQILEFAHQYLAKNGKDCAVLVPADEQLFDFYRHRGFREGFHIREVWLDRFADLLSEGASSCIIKSISPREYNLRRAKQLKGKRYTAYTNEDIAYQKRLSQWSGADIYGLEAEGEQGCCIIEMPGSHKAVIKELLISEEWLPRAVKAIMQLFPGKEYLLRTPAFIGKKLGGVIRPYGMIRPTRETDLETTPEDFGYLGLAFD
ncbi:GNAT family N-acetyltransferase [Syntrophobotulus glycolicus]|uniref:GNAT family N-acetyltransferase n=1 Tax=Syntrophobotulus glycolicus TaxID=51197 RepID=UPI00059B98E7|nr:GNAT family N-acetyltransferase [Syntrophobotulus glycolicus]